MRHLSSGTWKAPAVSAALACCVAACSPNEIPSSSVPQVVDLARFEEGAFLENLVQTRDGDFIVTHYFDRSLVQVKRSSEPQLFAQLDIHPSGIATLPDGFLVVGHERPFTELGQDPAVNAIITLDGAGRVQRTLRVDGPWMLNGAVAIPGGSVLITDSPQGVIWRFDPASGELSLWLDHPHLKAAPPGEIASAADGLGVNGIDIDERGVFVTNSSKGTLLRIALDDAGKPGEPEIFATLTPGRVDDIHIDNDGTIYVASHAEEILSVGVDGQVTVIAREHCGGCTSLVVDRAHGTPSLVVPNTGHFLAGGKPARVVSIPLR